MLIPTSLPKSLARLNPFVTVSSMTCRFPALPVHVLEQRDLIQQQVDLVSLVVGGVAHIIADMAKNRGQFLLGGPALCESADEGVSEQMLAGDIIWSDIADTYSRKFRSRPRLSI
jgi:hypothetical protein